MNWLEIIQQIFEVCILPLLGAVSLIVAKRITAKWAADEKNTNSLVAARHLTHLNDIILACIKATNQTYVNTLKAQGAFDEVAKRIALNKTKDAVLLILEKETKKYLEANIGDLEAYIIEQIESSIEDVKYKQ